MIWANLGFRALLRPDNIADYAGGWTGEDSGRSLFDLPITVQHTEESLCLAHIYAVAGMAGVNFSVKYIYDYGVDGQFSARPIRISGTLERQGRRWVLSHPQGFSVPQ